ncbi:DUF2061 domain-containing protein [Parvibaculum sedimenti]|uniref:DUF2061 domain-containing protein n=1 Tax=Parvibaculum sedimenti TaxID=2608632 RepID=A0A6N6VK55_9HYPH|nr:DUF2061 domain-containing protein [Parvibaculum sedimenti]KAB7742075.1 DUF2061 domain-containing protein [Parvibaculum sedimenti]
MRAARKAVAFSVVHFFVGLAVAYALTGQAALAASVALVEPAVNALIHFAYESWHDGHNGAMRAA